VLTSKKGAGKSGPRSPVKRGTQDNKLYRKERDVEKCAVKISSLQSMT
jgi:hypothetical protein